MTMRHAIRRATLTDGPEVRLLVTEFLLQAGFDAPDEARDVDLVDEAYYHEPERGFWVAEDVTGRLTGCVAIDRGEPGIAVMRRLIGEPLDDLAATATGFARGVGYREIEAVVPPNAEAQRRALLARGFTSEGEHSMLYRLRFE
jgi:hypothetical protein